MFVILVSVIIDLVDMVSFPSLLAQWATSEAVRYADSTNRHPYGSVVRSVLFRSRPQPVRYDSSPFRTAKEKPIRRSTEECRPIRFSCCSVPAAAVRSYAESRSQSESEYSFINQCCRLYARFPCSIMVIHWITKIDVPNLGTKKWAQYSITALTLAVWWQ